MVATHSDRPTEDDAPAMVVVVNHPADLSRAIQKGWYRIPLDRAPNRIAAEYLAFYQTGAFAPEERFVVRWMAAVRGYFLVTRRELIPEEPEHKRADEQYFKVLLDEVVLLPRPIPSRRLRRITFIPTTLSRLCQAEEINDLWIKNPAQERLWAALKQAGLDGESQYPLQDDLAGYVADLALFCREGRIAVIMAKKPGAEGQIEESREMVTDYLAQSGRWRLLRTSTDEMLQDPAGCVSRLAAWVREMGGLVEQTNVESLGA
jgi:very-short-patch-repair endonuclease